jgi:hypothetical protein
MSAHTPDKPAVIVPLASVSKGQPAANLEVDGSGRAIVALLKKAAEIAKDDQGFNACVEPIHFAKVGLTIRDQQPTIAHLLWPLSAFVRCT